MTRSFSEHMDAGLDVLADLVRREALVFAAASRAVADLVVLAEAEHGQSGVEQFLLLEIAGTCALGQGAAATRVGQAVRLTGTLTGTLAGLESGSVSVGQARVVLEQTDRCERAVAVEVERRLLAPVPVDPADPAGPVRGGIEGVCPADLRRRVAELVLQVEAELQPQVTRARLAEARASQRVVVRPEPDGMGSLWALLPAEQLRAFAVGLDELVRRQKLTDLQVGVQRTADQRRADLLAMLPALALHALAGTDPRASCGPVNTGTGTATGTATGLGAGPATGTGLAGAVAHPAVQIVLHTPMATALGLSERPGQLDGYGPVSAEQVRLLLPDAALRRLAVDATSGRPLAADIRTSRPAGTAPDARRVLLGMLADPEPVRVDERPEPRYAPSAGLARLVRLRDRRCSGPGCSQPASRCDLDHRRPWPAGPTSAGNLRATSRRCHRAKTISWTVREHPDGRGTWTSPLGRSYTRPPAWSAPPRIDPAARLLPAPPDDHDPERPGDTRHDLPDGSLTAQLDPPPPPPPPPPPTREWPDEPPF